MTAKPSAERLKPLKECINNYDVGEKDADWPNNIISTKTVVYESGAIARKGEAITHNVPPDELELCKKLAERACNENKPLHFDFGSDASSPMWPFYIAANVDDSKPEKITADLIKQRFNGTIFPLATITAEPLEEEGKWWNDVTANIESSGNEDKEGYFGRYQEMIKWFNDEPAFIDAAFVRIGDRDELEDIDDDDYPPGTVITPCVLPRATLGLTKNGSLTGIFSYTVQS